MLPFLLCIVEFIREEIIAILGMVFISFFNQVAMEVMLAYFGLCRTLYTF